MRLQKALIKEVGMVNHYAEAVTTERGIVVKHSVSVRPCLITGLTEGQAERLVNSLAALLNEAKAK